MSIRFARSIAVLGACTLWAACSKGGNKADSAAVADSAARAATAATPPAPAAPALNDTSILGILDELNAADSSGGNLASTKGTAASVKSFGKDMMRDHHMLRKAGQDLAKKLKITPAPPAGDTIPAMAKTMSDSLTALAKGPAWDKWYIDHEVGVHQFVLSTLQTAQTAASDTSLKAAIGKAIPVIQRHLTNAQAIQGKLPAATASAAPGAAATPATGGAMAPADTTKKKP
jgi:putative membrane protein